MYRMIQLNIRGGIVHASVRYARANNRLLGSLYDPSKPTSYILYVDANNFYGWAMSQQMPDDKIKWLSNQECREAEIELSEKQTRNRYFEYHANSQEEYALLMKDYKQTGLISEKIAAFESKMANNEPPHHLI